MTPNGRSAVRHVADRIHSNRHWEAEIALLLTTHDGANVSARVAGTFAPCAATPGEASQYLQQRGLSRWPIGPRDARTGRRLHQPISAETELVDHHPRRDRAGDQIRRRKPGWFGSTDTFRLSTGTAALPLKLPAVRRNNGRRASLLAVSAVPRHQRASRIGPQKDGC